jgi:hypothetical protein
MMERRRAPRTAMVLSAEVIEMPSGSKLLARTCDVSRTGCYVDTLNPITKFSQVRVRLTRSNEIFEATGRVMYASPNLGMGINFESVPDREQARLDQWLSSVQPEILVSANR